MLLASCPCLSCGCCLSLCASAPRGGGTTLALSLLYRLSPRGTGWQKNSVGFTCRPQKAAQHPTAHCIAASMQHHEKLRHERLWSGVSATRQCQRRTCWLASCSFSSLSRLPSAPKLRTSPTLLLMQLAMTSLPDCSWMPSARNRLTLQQMQSGQSCRMS